MAEALRGPQQLAVGGRAGRAGHGNPFRLAPRPGGEELVQPGLGHGRARGVEGHHAGELLGRDQPAADLLPGRPRGEPAEEIAAARGQGVRHALGKARLGHVPEQEEPAFPLGHLELEEARLGPPPRPPGVLFLSRFLPEQPWGQSHRDRQRGEVIGPQRAR
jgi:hypothetical protein